MTGNSTRPFLWREVWGEDWKPSYSVESQLDAGCDHRHLRLASLPAMTRGCGPAFGFRLWSQPAVNN